MKIHLIGYFDTKEVWLNGKLLDPTRSQKIYNHSPDGFNFGYGGSGPAQLALAILLELVSEEEARTNYQKFKWDVVAKLPQSDFDQEIEFNL